MLLQVTIHVAVAFPFLLQELRRSLQEIKSAHATALGSHEREWLSRAREVELHWEGKIRDR